MSHRLIGLTGGICSGKSTVSQMFREKGFCNVIDFDELAAELRDRPDIQTQLTDLFGTYDRAELRKIVFADKDKLHQLNGVFAKPILDLAISRHIFSSHAITVWDSALLLDFPEELVRPEMDNIYVVHCPTQIRYERLVKRPGISPEVATNILNNQLTDEARINVAKQYNATVIDSSKELNDLYMQVNRIIEGGFAIQPRQ